jgi:CheY-like chemotaxis protein
MGTRKELHLGSRLKWHPQCPLSNVLQDMNLAMRERLSGGVPFEQARFLPYGQNESGGRRRREIVAKNVLVVEDEENVRELLVDALRANGYCAGGVGNGREALDMLRLLDYDMVVTDFHMPDMDGLQLMSQIKCLYPGTATILMTAEEWPELAREARRRGAFDVILKPFKYSQLLSVMKRGLRHCERRDRRNKFGSAVLE